MKKQIMSFDKMDKKLDKIHERNYVRTSKFMQKSVNFRYVGTGKDCCNNCSRSCLISLLFGNITTETHRCEHWKAVESESL